MTITSIILYPASNGAQFDHVYWTGTHFDLIRKHWGAYLERTETYIATDESPNFVAAALLTFKDRNAMADAMKDPGAPLIRADIPNFTNITPIRQIATFAQA